MSKIRCKMHCQAVKKAVHWNKDQGFIYQAEFSVVSQGSEEDDKFFAATPGGNLTLSTMAVDAFEAGKDYYVDLTLAE